VQEIYEDHVIWSRQFKLDAPSLSQVSVKGSVAFQVCEKSCITAKPVRFELPTAGSKAAPVSRGATEPPSRGGTTGTATLDQKKPDLINDADAKPAAVGVTDLSGMDCEASSGETDIRDKGLIYVLGVAFVFGLLALLTPCVFPMVPITVSFFLKQAEKRHSSPLKMALVYSGSIILTFTVLGLVVSALFGAAYVNTLANGIWLNLFLGLVLLFFSLNLLGLFEIIIPSWLLTFTGSKESAGGYLGVFFMALTFTLTSFTCTFAFLGLILVWAANGEIWWPLAGLVAFSTAFALPFFLLALFPSYLHKLPKSGGWMNRVKVVMGFIELAFMFKFLSVADIGWNGGPTILDYHTVMTAWMVISAVTGLYLIGKIQLSHDTPTEFVGVFPMVLSMLFFGLSAYIGIGLFAPKPPEGFLGRQIAAFAPPQLEGGIGPDGPYLVGEHDKQRYLLDFEAAKRAAIRDKKPLYIDFTGVNCINCRLMEKEVIAADAIQAKLENCIRVQLYCDVMPSKAVTDPVLASKLIEANQKLQQSWMGDASLPSYAFVSPDGTTILSKATGRVSTATFSAFMTCGAQKFRKINEQGVAVTAAEGSTPYTIRGTNEKWYLDFEGARKVAAVKGLPLAVNFITSQIIEGGLRQRQLSRLDIKKLLDKTVRVDLYVDEIPRGAGIDPERAERMVAQNRMLQERLTNDPQMSVLLLNSEGHILTQVVGTHLSDADLVARLEKGIRQWNLDKNSKSVALVNSN
jgi:thiol:disulfide interchange protein